MINGGRPVIWLLGSIEVIIDLWLKQKMKVMTPSTLLLDLDNPRNIYYQVLDEWNDHEALHMTRVQMFVPNAVRTSRLWMIHSTYRDIQLTHHC